MRWLSVIFLLLSTAIGGASLEWGRLPDLPDREGFAGTFAGIVSDDRVELIIASGALIAEVECVVVMETGVVSSLPG